MAYQPILAASFDVIRDGEQSASEAVVEAVASADGIEPVDLSPSLYEVVDPDALDKLVDAEPADRPAADVRVTFTYAGYRVTVTADGAVDLEPAPDVAP